MRKLLVVLLSVFLMVSSAGAKEVGGVTLPETMDTGKNTLLLNGAGIRKVLFMKAYVAGLYLMQQETNAKKIIDEDRPMAIRIQITSGLIDSEKMGKSIQKGFVTSTDGNIGPLEERIDQFISVIKENIKQGDYLDFIYMPNSGVVINKNGKPAGTTPGLDFKKALFGIWLADKPASKNLKKALLGQ